MKKDSHDLLSFEYEAVLEDCNLLDKLPRLEEVSICTDQR